MPRLPYEKRYRYPHLTEADKAIWDAFIEEHPDFFDEVEYDVLVGEGREPDPEDPEFIKRIVTYITKYKIDVVGYKDGTVSLVEIKPYAAASALGQLFVYRSLYERDINPLIIPRLIVVTDRLTDDMRYVYQYYGIDVYTVIPEGGL